MLKTASILAALAALLVIGEAVSTYLHAPGVSAVGGTGRRTIARSYVIVGSIELRVGPRFGLGSSQFDRVIVNMRVSDKSAEGSYEVTVVVRNDAEVYVVTRTVIITIVFTPYVFLLPRTVMQGSSVGVEVYAKKVG